MQQQTIVLFCSCIATLVTLIGIVWQASKTIAELKTALEAEKEERRDLQKAIADMRAALAQLGTIPLHEQRITQLERSVLALSKRVEMCWQKLFSMDKHVAVLRSQSSHDLEEHGSDPPPPGDDPNDAS